MNKLPSLLIGSLLAFVVTGSAQAIPKAAESEAAAVTYGADAPRPVKSRAGNTNPAEKKRVAKTVHKAKRGKAHRH